VRHRLGIPEIVRSDNLEVATPLQVSPKEVASNPPKPINPNSRLGHSASLLFF
jgi:hypothetical protein